MSDALADLSAQDVSIWLDDISRERLRTGNLADLMREFHVVGVTSNPTIFAGALSKGDAYDEQAAELKLRGVTLDEASRAITTYDIRWACDVLRPVYDATGGQDGRVSLEVDPRLAKNTEATIALHDGLALYVELPASAELLISYTEPGMQGDRSTGGTKPATLETGAQIQVPLFITTGEKVKVDTRTGDYIGRINS